MLLLFLNIIRTSFVSRHKIFLFLLTLQTSSGANPLRIQKVSGILWRIKRPGCESEHSTSSSSVGMNKRNYSYISNEMGWAYGAYGWGEGVYRVLVGKPEGRRPLGRPRRRWVDNIRLNFQEVWGVYMDWIGLAQDRDSWRMVVSAVMNLRVPWNAGNFLTSCKPVSFSRRTVHHGVSK